MKYLVSGTMTLKFKDFIVEADSEEEALRDIENGEFDEMILDLADLDVESTTVTSAEETDEDYE